MMKSQFGKENKNKTAQSPSVNSSHWLGFLVSEALAPELWERLMSSCVDLEGPWREGLGRDWKTIREQSH